MMRVPSPDGRNVSNYMEANNIIKEEDEGDSDATSGKGADKGKSTEVAEDMADHKNSNSSTKAAPKQSKREATADAAVPLVAGATLDKASNNNVAKHPGRQGTSQIAA